MELRGQIQTVIVTERNLIDEDLDGIIDEDVNLHFTRRAQDFGRHQDAAALRYKNYVGFARAVQNRTPARADSVDFGLLNPMIDEARDDGADNDGDWNASTDDVGADGVQAPAMRARATASARPASPTSTRSTSANPTRWA